VTVLSVDKTPPYEKPAKYSIMTKVISIFDNNTSQVFETEVK